MKQKIPNYSNSPIDYCNSYPLARFRYWLIKKLVGKSAVAINIHVVPYHIWEAHVACRHHFKHGMLIHNCCFDGAATLAPNDGEHGERIKDGEL